MKTFRVVVNEMNADGTVGELHSICEFDVENPTARHDSTIFGLIKQYEAEEIEHEAAQPMFAGEFELNRDRSIAVQDGAHKVLAGEMSAECFFQYYVDPSLFPSRKDYVERVTRRVQGMQS